MKKTIKVLAEILLWLIVLIYFIFIIVAVYAITRNPWSEPRHPEYPQVLQEIWLGRDFPL